MGTAVQAPEAGGVRSLWRRLRFIVLPGGLVLLVVLAARQSVLSNRPESFLMLASGAMVSQLAMLAIAVRFRAVLSASYVDMPLGRVYAMQMQSMFYHFLAPCGVGADAARCAKLVTGTPVVGLRTALLSVSFDRAIGLATMVLLAAASFPAGLRMELEKTGVQVPGLIVWTSIGIVAAAAVAAVLLRARWHVCRRWRQVRLRGSSLLAALGASLVMQVLLAAGAWIGAMAWSIELGYVSILFGVCSAFLFQVIPINIGGAGAAEAAGYGVYLLLGLQPREALLLVSTIYSYRLLSAVIGGVIEWFSSR